MTDRLVVSELSRLGRSLGQVIQIVDELVKRKVRFTAIKVFQLFVSTTVSCLQQCFSCSNLVKSR